MNKEDNSPIYLQGLNGIRALAAFGVMLSHINLSLTEFDIKDVSLFGFDKSGNQLSYTLGSHGVTMFFVLSGFLITFLLIKERNKINKINYKHFYIRRILRIWPLYFLYLSLGLILLVLFQETVPNKQIIFFYIFLLANIPFIEGVAPTIFGHLWSIAVEEQFYIFWPHLFSSIGQLFKKVLILILLLGTIRLVIRHFHPNSFWAILSSVNRFDCMMIGGLIAILLEEQSEIILYLNKKIIQTFAWIVMFSLILNVFKTGNALISYWTVSIATATIIIGQIKKTNRLINLDNKILNFLGMLSFGIYVYHPLVIWILGKAQIFTLINNHNIRSFSIFVLVIATTIIISYLSYKYFEKRFLIFKGKFSHVKSTNVKL